MILKHVFVCPHVYVDVCVLVFLVACVYAWWQTEVDMCLKLIAIDIIFQAAFLTEPRAH